MKSSVAAIGMFAVAANAWAHPRHLADNWAHPRHFHYARDNTTSTAPVNATVTATDAGLTTMTVIATQTHTITSCAPTVTNCPADQTGISALPETDKTTFVVTDTVQLTETVCPVTDAPSISASVISDASSGLITGTPITTAPPAETTASDAEAVGDSTTDIVVEKTLTITLGSGTAASVVTSTVAVTSEGSDAEETGSEEPTTTTTATGTKTRTITLTNADTTETATGVAGESGGSDSGECAPTTVTVTEPASTVYVTVGGETASQTADAEVPANTDDADDEDGDDEDDDDEDDDDDECPIESTTTMQTTLTVAPTTAPYPTGNGTVTSGIAGPTGLARRFRFQ